METWYYSPYPIGYQNVETLFICEFCLNPYTSEVGLEKHTANCPITNPPGDEIYRDDEKEIAVFEIMGAKNVAYSENLCYLAKLFLDHKTLMLDCTPFAFFVLTERDEYGYHLVGYFSREIYSDLNYNLNCILVLPHAQRKGYGKFLIKFSYEISKLEKKMGTPERPLSDLARRVYISWWRNQIIRYMLDN